MVYTKRNEFAPKGNKFFSVRVEHFSKGRQTSFDRVASESVLTPIKGIFYCFAIKFDVLVFTVILRTWKEYARQSLFQPKEMFYVLEYALKGSLKHAFDTRVLSSGTYKIYFFFFCLLTEGVLTVSSFWANLAEIHDKFLIFSRK